MHTGSSVLHKHPACLVEDGLFCGQVGWLLVDDDDRLAKLLRLEATVSARLEESLPAYAAALSKELRGIWSEIDVIRAEGVEEVDDDLAARRQRIEAVRRRSAEAAG